jgi:hypothetical protein
MATKYDFSLKKASTLVLQPTADSKHRDSYMSFMKNLFCRSLGACTIALVSLSAPMAIGQAATAASSAQDAQPAKSSDVLNPALNVVSQTMAGLNISRWKAPGEVRGAMQQNADSISRDLHNTLPGLLAQADAAPNSIPAILPVYRNVDALYDVLLRVSETANLAAPENESANISSSLNQLESARKDLSNVILSIAKNQEAEMTKLRATVAQYAATQQAAPAKTTVVDDGPAKTSSTKPKHKKKPAPAQTPTKPAAEPAPSQPQ